MAANNPPLEHQIARALADSGLALDEPTSLRAKAVARHIAAEIERGQATLLGEIGSLADYIREARAELAHLRAEELGSEKIRMATDELDAVVTATEDATGSIMDACETIENLASENLTSDPQSVPRDAIINEVTRIYEACSFQDITGQRISKVVSTLKHIEMRVEEMLQTFDCSPHGYSQQGQVTKRSGEADSTDADSDLLNGPQMPGQGVDQDEIDRLLNGSGF